MKGPVDLPKSKTSLNKVERISADPHACAKYPPFALMVHRAVCFLISLARSLVCIFTIYSLEPEKSTGKSLITPNTSASKFSRSLSENVSIPECV